MIGTEQFDAQRREFEGKRWWEVWAEGYAATCEHGTATFVGRALATTFDEAALSLHTDAWGPVGRDATGRLVFWACRLFDNEADARRSYG